MRRCTASSDGSAPDAAESPNSEWPVPRVTQREQLLLSIPEAGGAPASPVETRRGRSMNPRTCDVVGCDGDAARVYLEPGGGRLLEFEVCVSHFIRLEG